MYYRRKVILSLLQLFEGKLEKIRLQKLLFLYSQQQLKPEYEFIPYRFGCFSYSANADMIAMVKRQMLQEDEKHFIKSDTIDYLKLLKGEDATLLQKVKEDYGTLNANTLMKLTYIEYPFYATRSEVAANILSKTEMKDVLASLPDINDTILFTIGYEGISLENYLVRLLKNDVKILVDVRRNPLSMKYGFNKNQLIKYCGSIGIDYIHLPDVGIHSVDRKKLDTQADYDILFDQYRKTSLKETQATQQVILDLLHKNKRIALTCFEANICQCHRKHLSEAITLLPGWRFTLKHI
jgi:uncharacterized protein (DUF488 family)